MLFKSVNKGCLISTGYLINVSDYFKDFIFQIFSFSFFVYFLFFLTMIIGTLKVFSSDI